MPPLNPPGCEPRPAQLAASGPTVRHRRSRSPGSGRATPWRGRSCVALETALSRIRGIEADARRGDAEGIHRLRTTTRRLRSELRAFRDLVDPELDRSARRRDEMARRPARRRPRPRRAHGAVPQGRRRRRTDRAPERWHPCSPTCGPACPRIARAAKGLARGAVSRPARGPPARHRPSVARHARAARPAARRCRRSPPGPGDGSRSAAARSGRATPTRRSTRSEARQAGPIHGRDGRPRPVRGRRQGGAPVHPGGDPGPGRARRTPGCRRRRPGDRRRCSSARPTTPAFQRAAHRLLDGQAEAARAARDEFFDVWDKLDRKKSRRWLAPIHRLTALTHAANTSHRMNHNDHQHHAHPPDPSESSRCGDRDAGGRVVARDPVCGMDVVPETAAGSIEHDGRTIYFCSRHCLERFRPIRPGTWRRDHAPGTTASSS